MTATNVATSPQVPGEKKRYHFPQLDVLRAIAIIAVFFFHGTILFHHDQLPWQGWFRDFAGEKNPGFLWLYPITFGWFGVPLFFVLSGFVIHLSFLQAKQFDTLNFLWRRFWRIYPAYFVALLAFSLQERVIPSTLIHALLLHNFKKEYFFTVNPSFWSLAVEIQFYLLYPLLLVIRQRLGMQRTFWLAVMLSLVTRIAIFLLLPESRQDVSGITILWASVPALWMDWIAGACVAEAFVSGIRFYSDTARKLLPLLLLAAVILTQVRYGFVVSFSLFSLYFAGLIENIIHRPFRVDTPINKILIPIGIWSYSIYLWHQPILINLATILEKRVPGLASSVPGYFLLCILSAIPAIAVAYLSYRFVEMRAMKWGNALWNRFHSRNAAS